MPRFPASRLFLFLLITLAALPLALVAPPAAAQEPQTEGEFAGEIEVTEVALDVLVTDSQGNAILGLEPKDFQITDGDAEVDVTSATFYSNRSFVESGLAADRLGVSPTDVPVDRYFILFFQDQRGIDPSLVRDLTEAVFWTKKWVEEEVQLSDWIAVLSYDTKLKVHTDFTRDTDMILEALTGVAKGRDPGANWPSRQKSGDNAGPSLTKNLPQGNDLRKQTRRMVYSGLKTTAEAAGYITGRKNLMFYSVGFGQVSDFGTYQVDKRYYPSMMESLNDNNVAVYAISLKKNLANETTLEGLYNNGLSLLADDTDGQYYFNFANFKNPLAEVVRDNNGYYLVTYKASIRPDSEKARKKATEEFREVDVKLDNPEFVVRARKGYYWD